VARKKAGGATVKINLRGKLARDSWDREIEDEKGEQWGKKNGGRKRDRPARTRRKHLTRKTNELSREWG